MSKEIENLDSESTENLKYEAENQVLSLEEKRQQFGFNLKEAREKLGQSQRDIVHLTRISPPFIQALEDGNFTTLPGEVFGRGFIKNICKVLEISPSKLLEEYNQCWEKETPKAKKYNISQTFVKQKYRQENSHKKKSFVPLSNYFSSKGALLWIGSPALILALSLLYVFNPLNFGNKKEHSDLKQQDELVSSPSKESEKTPKELQDKNSETLAEKTTNSTEKPLKSVSAAEKVEKVKEILPKGLSLVNNNEKANSQVYIKVKEQVEIRFRLDKDDFETKVYKKGNYRFTFKEKVDFFIEDTNKIEMSFNDRPLGDFQASRDRKQLTFVAGQKDIKL